MTSLVKNNRDTLVSHSESINANLDAFQQQSQLYNIKEDLFLLDVLNKNIRTTIKCQNEEPIAFDYGREVNNMSDSQNGTNLLEQKRRLAYQECEKNVLSIRNKSLEDKLSHVNTHEEICSSHILNILEKLSNCQKPTFVVPTTDSQRLLELESLQLKTTINNLKNVIENNTCYFYQKIENLEQLSIESEQDLLNLKNERNILESENQNLIASISNMKSSIQQSKNSPFGESLKNSVDCNCENDNCKVSDIKNKLNKKRDLEYEIKKLSKISNIKLIKAEAKIKDLEAQSLFQNITYQTERKQSSEQIEKLKNEISYNFVYETPKQVDSYQKNWEKILKIKGESKINTTSRRIRKPKRKFSFESFEDLQERLGNNLDVFESESEIECEPDLSTYNEEESMSMQFENCTRDETINTIYDETENSNGQSNIEMYNNQENEGVCTPKNLIKQ